MAKVNVKFDELGATRKLLKTFDKVKANKQMNKEIGETTVKRIQGEARRQKPLNAKRRFPSLKQMTVAQRKRLAFFNKTHPSFGPGKSNLTLTGQLIDAVVFEVRNTSIFISVEESRRKGYKTGPGGRSKKTLTNKELDKILRKIGFKLFTPRGVDSDTKLKKRLKNILLRTLRRALGVSRRLDKLQ